LYVYLHERRVNSKLVNWLEFFASILSYDV
jgi:hypothetical protein